MTIGKNSETSAFAPSIMGRSPYYDDYNPAKKFLKVLFKPGVPLQARELSQAQSILQNQIERFGKHIFENGSVVLGGEVTVSKTNFIRLDNSNVLSTTALKEIVGQRITDGSTTIATVVGAFDQGRDSDGLSQDPHQVLFFNYNTSGQFNTGTLSTTGDGNLGFTAEIASGDITGGITGTATNFITVSDGVFFLDGYFALNDSQETAAFSITGGYRDFQNPSTSVGFNVLKTTVNAVQDPSLNDPAFGFNNYNSPGSDRFKIEPTLTQIGITGSTVDPGGFVIDGATNDYVELVRVVNGTTTKRVRIADYAEIEKTLAERTFDESGNYTVNPFTLTLDEYDNVFSSEDETKLAAVLSPGKAYVNGYVYETIAPSNFEIDKARTTTRVSRETVETPEGSFFQIFNSENYRLHTVAQSQTIEGGKALSVFDSTKTFIGTMNLRMVRRDGTSVKFYFFNLRLNEGKNIEDVKFVQDTNIENLESPVNTTWDSTNFGATLETVSFKSFTNNRQVFPIPLGDAVSDINGEDFDSTFTVVKTFSGTADSNGDVTFSGGGDNDFFESNLTVMGATDGNPATLIDVDLSSSSNPNNETGDITLSCGTTNEGSRIVATIPMRYQNTPTNQNIRKKTLVRNSIIDNVTLVNGIGSLSTPDVTELVSVTQNGVDITDKFTLDDGQKIDRYDYASVVLKQGESVDTSANALSVTVHKYTHDYGFGGPFTKQSYVESGLTAGLEFSPIFNDPETGESLRLFNSLDFRPIRINDAGNFAYGTDGVSFDNSTVPNFDLAFSPFVSFETFAERKDSIVLGSDRVLRVVQGSTGEIISTRPTIPEDDLELYRVTVPAFTYNIDDVKVQYLNNQRFTMKDIGNIEDATFADNEFNYRAALEAQALSAAVGLFPGAEGFDEGIFVDDLIGHGNADVTKTQHNVAIDPVDNTLKAPFDTQSPGVTNNGGSNFARYSTAYGDIYTSVSPAADEISFASGFDPSSTINVNNFAVADYLGTVKLNPFCDRYWSETKAAKVIVNTSGENNAWKKGISAPIGVEGKKLGFGTQWKDWESIWFGRSIENETENDQTDPDNIKYRPSVRSSFVRRVLSNKIIKEIGGKIVDLSIVPYMRAVTIKATVEGMRPNSTIYAYFDGKAVGNTASGYSVGSTGSAGEIQLDIPADTYLTGEKIVRFIDNTDNDLNLATTSADSTFYASGSFETNEEGVNSFRPLIRRRDSSSSDSILNADYLDLVGTNSASVVNSLNPLAQTFTVDQNDFPDGMILSRIKVLFASKPDDDGGVIRCEIRPVDSFGYPKRNYVMPCSEVYKTPSEVSVYAEGDNINAKKTEFNFKQDGGPVYLSPGTYAICFLSNDPNYSIWSNDTTSTKPLTFDSVFIPSNNGQVTRYGESYLALGIDRSAYDSNTETNVRFTMSGDNENTAHNASYIATTKQLLSSRQIQVGYGTGSLLPINATNLFPNIKTLELTNLNFFWTPTDRSSNIIDVAQVQPLFINSKVESVDATELTLQTLANDNLATATARYYSKVVSLPQPAANLAVRIKAKTPPNSRIYVFGKFKGTNTSGSLDDQPYIRLTSKAELSSENGGDPTTIESVVNTYTAPASTASAISDTGLYTEYKIKIVLSHSGQNNRLPEILQISAVPLGRKTSEQFFQTITPTGTVVPYAGKFNPPEGFLLCDGSVHEKDEFEDLYEVLGGAENPYNTDTSIDTATQFQVPNMQGRVPIGENTGVVPSGDVVDGTDNRSMGNTGGHRKVAMHQHTGLLSRLSDNGNLIPGLISQSVFNFGAVDQGSGGDASDGFFGNSSRSINIQGGDMRTFATSATGGLQTPGGGDDGSLVDTSGYITDTATGNMANEGTVPTGISMEQMPPYVVTRYIIKV
jgi:hypothetical protein